MSSQIFRRHLALATVTIALVGSCRGPRAPKSGTAVGLSGEGGVGRQAPQPTARPALDLPDLERRRKAWVERPTPARGTAAAVRASEASSLELTSLAQEAAIGAMGLGEGERRQLQQAEAVFRDAATIRLEHPPERRDAATIVPAPFSVADGPPSPERLFVMRQRAILGQERYQELWRLEQRERARLIARRQVFLGVEDRPAPRAPMLSPVP
ncbi:MAG: hypothetical protein ABSB49_08600 [Polyangia bacterium]